MPNTLEILSKYTSANGANLIYACLQRNPFNLKISEPRKTRLGDYRFDSRINKHQISINNDLKGDAFLFTMLHEIAHQLVQLKYGNRVEPHGQEWKNEYQTLLMQALKVDAFEKANLIIKALDNIKSSSVYNQDIYRQLYANPNEDEQFLGNLKDGRDFIFNAILFRKIQKNRSRCLCLNLENDRQYLISNQALVMEIVE